MSNERDEMSRPGKCAIVRGNNRGGAAMCAMCSSVAPFGRFMVVYGADLFDAMPLCGKCSQSMCPDLAEMALWAEDNINLCNAIGQPVTEESTCH